MAGITANWQKIFVVSTNSTPGRAGTNVELRMYNNRGIYQMVNGAGTVL